MGIYMTLKKSAGICLMLLLQAWPSYADSKFNTHNDLFLHLDIGLFLSKNMKGNHTNYAGNSMIFGAGIKYQVIPKIKIGGNFVYRPGYEYKNIYKRSIKQFNIASYMVNASYDITKIGDNLTPYAEIGMGISHIKLKEHRLNVRQKVRLQRNIVQKKITNTIHAITLDDTHTFSKQTFKQFTMSGAVGLVYKINNDMDIDINYKYTNFGKIKYLGKIASDELTLSLRFKM